MKILIVAGLFFATVASAVSTSNLTPESHISGPSYSEKELQGRVIAVECWGRYCPPCRESLPHMAKLAKRYAQDKRLVFIGAHWQARDDKEIIQLLAQNGCEYAVYQAFNIDGMPLPSSLPFAYVINHEGETVYTGYPSDAFGKAIVAALKKAPEVVDGALIPALSLKYYKDATKQLVAGKNIERYMAQLKTALPKADAKAEEAQQLLQYCSDWVENEKQLIQDNLETYPSKALLHLQLLVKTMPSLMAPFKDTFAQLSQDKMTNTLANSRKFYEKIHAQPSTTKTQRAQLLTAAKSKLRQLATLTPTSQTEDFKDVETLWNTLIERLSN